MHKKNLLLVKKPTRKYMCNMHIKKAVAKDKKGLKAIVSVNGKQQTKMVL